MKAGQRVLYWAGLGAAFPWPPWWLCTPLRRARGTQLEHGKKDTLGSSLADPETSSQLSAGQKLDVLINSSWQTNQPHIQVFNL